MGRAVTATTLLLLVFCCPLGSWGKEASRDRGVEQDIWLSYNQKLDFMDPYLHPEKWPQTLARIKVLQLPVPFTSRMSDRQLTTIFAFLKAHNVGFALEAPMLVPGARDCGRGIEGYAEDFSVAKLAVRLKALGGRPLFISMDEPLYFGHFATHYWRPASETCRAPLQDLADNAARVIAEVRAVYPRIMVGEVEPVATVAGVSEVEKMAALRSWLIVYSKRIGTKLAFLHFDVTWSNTNQSALTFPLSWAHELVASYRLAEEYHIRSGVIYDGSPRDLDGPDWERHALGRAVDTEQHLNLNFDDILFESWTRYPDSLLPEDKAGTMTNLVCHYLLSKPRFAALKVNRHFAGDHCKL